MADKRKTLDIKHDFQHQLIMQTILTLIIAINVLVVVLMVISASRFGPPPMWIPLTIVAIEGVTFAVVYRRSLKASHTIAGPVFAIERILGAVARGELHHRLRLRSTDHFQETATLLNEALDAFEGRIAEIRAVAESLETQGGLDDEGRRQTGRLRELARSTGPEG